MPMLLLLARSLVAKIFRLPLFLTALFNLIHLKRIAAKWLAILIQLSELIH